MNICEDCLEKEVVCKNKCNRCYKYFWRNKICRPIDIFTNFMRKGTQRKDGYRSFSIKGIRILEHTYVYENFLGRKLLKGETIHHKNGIRNDNRIENLELWTKNHPPGQRVSDLIVWCKQFLEMYDKNQRKNQWQKQTAQSKKFLSILKKIRTNLKSKLQMIRNCQLSLKKRAQRKNNG